MEAINSQISFGRAAAANKKAVNKENTGKTQQPKPKFNELGKRTMSEKYGDTNLTTESAPIILGDYITDHVLEFMGTAAAFIGTLAAGKKVVSGMSGELVNATKNFEKVGNLGDFLQGSKKYVSQVGDFIKTAKLSKGKNAQGIGNAISELGQKAENNGVLKDSFIDKLSGKLAENAEQKPNSLTAKFVDKFVKKEAVNKDGDKVILSTKDAINKAFADKGITRGADLADNAIALTGATVAAVGANDVADKATDLNDDNVAEKAQKANAKYYARQVGRIADAALNMI